MKRDEERQGETEEDMQREERKKEESPGGPGRPGRRRGRRRGRAEDEGKEREAGTRILTMAIRDC